MKADASVALYPRPDLPAEEHVITSPVNVQPLYYTQLRLLAECAAGRDETTTDFLFDGATLRVQPEGIAPPDDEILITSGDPPRHPRNTVQLQVVAGEQIGAGTPPLELSFADAVFWSDAAVQKFLFPYIASCSGHEAAQKLTAVQNAWNYYPQDLVTVYAIARALPRAGDSLLLERAIHVIHSPLGLDTLLSLPLDEFLALYQPGLVPLGSVAALPTMPYWRGGPGTPPQYPDYAVLRGMAEYGASLCSQAAYFVLRSDGPTRFTGPFDFLDVDLADGDIVVPVYNPTEPSFRPQLGGVWFQPPGPDAEMRNLSVQPEEPGWDRSADALFWSTGAIEQFLFPYYASTAGFNGLLQLADMAATWMLDLPFDLGSRSAAHHHRRRRRRSVRSRPHADLGVDPARRNGHRGPGGGAGDHEPSGRDERAAKGRVHRPESPPGPPALPDVRSARTRGSRVSAPRSPGRWAMYTSRRARAAVVSPSSSSRWASS